MNVELPIRKAPRYTVRLFFILLLLLGGVVFRHYGVSWDEPTDRMNGLVSLRFVCELAAPQWAAKKALLQQAPLLRGYKDNDHGVLFELPLALYDVVRPGNDPRDYYLVRHLTVYLTSLVGIWALFRLATLRFRDERLGLLAAGLLVLSPRFFAESFYNGKDIPFVALFTLGIYTLVWLLERPSWRRAVVHGLVTAAATDIRILGLLLGPFTFTLLVLQFVSSPSSFGRRILWYVGLAYLLALAAGVVAGWPYLWEHTLEHLADAFTSLSHFEKRWNGELLYWGQIIRAADVPWHYALVWITITTPVAYQLAGLLGLGVVTAELLRRPWPRLRTAEGRLDLLIVGWLVLPLAAVIGLHSSIYDGWRHLYFIYPALLLLAIRGGLALAHLGRRGAGWRRLALGLGLLAGAEALLTVGRMVYMHPHQQTYFSYLPRQRVARLFERDYWGVSYRQGLEYLVAQHPTGPIYVEPAGEMPFENNKIWVAESDRERVLRGPDMPGRYFIVAYRGVLSYPASVGTKVYTLRADGVPILSIFKRGTDPVLPTPPTPSASENW